MARYEAEQGIMKALVNAKNPKYDEIPSQAGYVVLVELGIGKPSRSLVIMIHVNIEYVYLKCCITSSLNCLTQFD
jgi:hypothetical protein